MKGERKLSSDIMTVMDLEFRDVPSYGHGSNKVTTGNNANLVVDDSVILNPDKDAVMAIIDEIYNNDGKCNKDLRCPCDTFLKYRHCGRGLFKNIRGGN